MGEKKYVNAVARKLKCDGKRKREIKKQLLADIQMRENQGERLEEIISRMGKAGAKVSSIVSTMFPSLSLRHISNV